MSKCSRLEDALSSFTTSQSPTDSYNSFVENRKAILLKRLSPPATFVVVDADGKTLSEHDCAKSACRALIQYCLATQEDGMMMKRVNDRWEIY